MNPGIELSVNTPAQPAASSLPMNAAARKYQPGRTYLSAAAVSARIGLSESVIWDYSRTGKFPPSVGVGDGTRRWLEDDIDAFMVSLIRARDAAPPKNPRPIAAPIDPATLTWPPRGLRKLTFASGRRCGIYFLLQGNTVVYVGSSVDISWRVGRQCASKKFDSVNWLPIQKDSLLRVERAWILALKPKLNGRTTPAGVRQYFAPGTTQRSYVTQARTKP